MKTTCRKHAEIIIWHFPIQLSFVSVGFCCCFWFVVLLSLICFRFSNKNSFLTPWLLSSLLEPKIRASTGLLLHLRKPLLKSQDRKKPQFKWNREEFWLLSRKPKSYLFSPFCEPEMNAHLSGGPMDAAAMQRAGAVHIDLVHIFQPFPVHSNHLISCRCTHTKKMFSLLSL